MMTRTFLSSVALASVLAVPGHASGPVFPGNVVVQNSLCVGFDCPAGPAFGFDTVRLQENNLRIHFDDTSVAAAFPRNDWGFQANDSANGGDSYMAILDRTANRQVFRVDAGARSNALYVDSAGDVGIGTSTPVVELHAVRGDTPTLRLEQDGSSGFTPQTFDVAGNEVGFFVRDATFGSTLPFRILVGAPSAALLIDGDGDIGMGAGTNPGRDLHVERASSDNPTEAQFENSAGAAVQLRLVTSNNNNRRINGLVSDGDTASSINLGDDVITLRGTTGQDLATIDAGGIELPAGSAFSVDGTNLNVPDYVFAPDYALMPLPELRAFVTANSHLPGVPSATEVQTGGLNMTEMQLTLLEKVEELTLYTLQQQAQIADHQAEIAELRALLTAD